jgi:hypothetical protein
VKKLTVAVGLTFAAISANATVIDPGASVAPNAVATAVGGGSTTLLTLSGPYLFNVFPADISATYVETAYADTTNPFNSSPGVYDTAIVLKITVGKGTATIERATLGYFGDFRTSASYLTGSAAVPTSATRDIVGSVIGYSFTGLTPGEVETLVVYTNGTDVNSSGRVSVQDGTAGYNTGISLASAPEPTTVALLGSSLAVLGAAGRRRGRRKALLTN